MKRIHGWHCTLALLVSYLAGIECFAPRSLAQEQPGQQAALRDYANGALTADDYLADIPQPLPSAGNTRLLAFTWLRVRYQYRYKYVQQGSRFTVTLTDFNAAALIDRTVSWNAAPADQQLLDHEQGHFDIAHLASQRLRREIEQMRSAGTPVAVNGQSLSEALKALEMKLDAIMRSCEDAAAKEHVQYDQMTSHGTVGSAQRHFRGEQRKAIEILRRELPVSELSVLQ